MHLAREVMFSGAFEGLLATLRPTLIYGAADPHNGYGPDRFRRLAAAGKPIVLFGEGEERRDHVWIDDVADLAAQVVLRRSVGALNIATGTTASFRDIAKMVAGVCDRPVAVTGSPRAAPMPRNGYRSFDVAACRAVFPDFTYTTLDEGLARASREQAAMPA
jgi:UDP-glucose 4-epimerase